MNTLTKACRGWVVTIFLLSAAVAPADPVLPGNVLDPQSAAEAWNAIRLSTSNVARLLREKRLDEIPLQISFCSPALRALPRFTADPEAAARIRGKSTEALLLVGKVALAGNQGNGVGAAEEFKAFQARLDEFAGDFDARVMKSDIFYCAVHPEFVSEQAGTPCARCGMRLLPRRIPYSFVYVEPGDPTIRLTAVAAPLVGGRRTEVRIRLAFGGDKPVRPEDLLVVHTEPIHVLIEEPGLDDYHHEIPTATGVPGEYVFAFTPARTSPYRIWADVVPLATGVPELPAVDLPSEGAPQPIRDRSESDVSMGGGLTFTLTKGGGNNLPLRARQVRGLFVAVSDAQGQPVKRFEPFMNAFCHLVGFHEDYRSIVHLHPTGGDVLDPNARGGPLFGFKIFPPKPGFFRLYCQVKIDGKTILTKFNLNVLEE